MVIRLVPHRQPPLPELASALAVDLQSAVHRIRLTGVLKDPAHVVEQAGGRQHDGGRMEGVLPFEEEQGSGMET